MASLNIDDVILVTRDPTLDTNRLSSERLRVELAKYVDVAWPVSIDLDYGLGRGGMFEVWAIDGRRVRVGLLASELADDLHCPLCGATWWQAITEQKTYLNRMNVLVEYDGKQVIRSVCDACALELTNANTEFEHELKELRRRVRERLHPNESVALTYEQWAKSCIIGVVTV